MDVIRYFILLQKTCSVNALALLFAEVEHAACYNHVTIFLVNVFLYLFNFSLLEYAI